MPDWIRVDDDILDHKKTILLSRALGIQEVTIAGHLLGIWFFTLKNAWRDGDLSVWGADGLERAARWTGERGMFSEAFHNAGFAENFKIHNWRQYAAKYVQRRIQRERQNGDKKATARRQLGVSGATSVTSRIVTSRIVKTDQRKPLRDNVRTGVGSCS